MSTSSKPSSETFSSAIPPADLFNTAPVPISASPNPWADTLSSTSETISTPALVLPVDDPVFNPPIDTQDDIAASIPASIPVSRPVIDEFDPLAEAQATAWGDVQGHPPPPPPKETPPPPSTRQGLPIEDKNPTQSSGGFAGLAALASKLSISLPRPSIQTGDRSQASPQSRGRPQSFDGAAPVASPMIRSFAAQFKRVGKRQSVPDDPTDDPSAQTDPDAQYSDYKNEEENGKPESRIQSPARPAVPSKDEEKPFDFQLFLDQLKSRGAEPVAKYLRSFLSNFTKRTFTVHDQAKLVHDFLDFISARMREVEPWRTMSALEFDHAMEGMEKLVMNKIYDYTFTPHIVSLIPARPITCDDLDKDRALDQRIRLFTWLEPKHLDVPDEEGSQGFLAFAQQELVKINHYKAPRDKLICVLNCCKVIFGLIRHLHRDESADSFLPILIFVVIKANPQHLLSNVEFISRFRNPEKLQSEAGYYLSSLMGSVSFIENLDHTSLSNITKEEFDKNVDIALAAIPPSPALPPVTHVLPTSAPGTAPSTPGRPVPLDLPVAASPMTQAYSHTGEEAAQPLALPAPPPSSFPSAASNQSLGQALGDDARRLLKQTGDSLSRPLSAIGRLFSEVLDGPTNNTSDYPGVGGRNGPGSQTGGSVASYLPGPFAPFELGRDARQQAQMQPSGTSPHWQQQVYQPEYQPSPLTPAMAMGGPGGMMPPQIVTPYKPRVRRAPSSPGYNTPPSQGPGHGGPGTPFESNSPLPGLGPALQASLAPDNSVSRTPTPALDIPAMEAEIDAAHARAEDAARDTLAQIFPTVEDDVREMVLEANDGDLGRSIEALLEMTGGN